MALDMLLKDNEANRKEQMILFEQTEEYRLRMERKKKRKSTDKTRTSLDSNPSPVPSDSSEIKYQVCYTHFSSYMYIINIGIISY